MTDITVLGISGSLRAGSFNTALLRAARQLAPAGMTVELYEGLRDIPPYDGDTDTETPPEPVADLRRRISQADGVLFVTPEYNYSVPGVLKNAIDWASRPAGHSSLTHKPVAIMGASPGNFGAVRAQLALRQSFVWINARMVVQPEVMVFKAGERFDEHGTLTDTTTAALVRKLLDALATTIHTPAP
ncbi:NADPH-dependent FMN reductase [Longispora sp. NPDC051575]|uniref:NADPH-dependent FMN reductase n=1 Tax=Longispora sp. NPDC051575 TaxID=3154943 RepID=UPI003440C41B